MSAVHLIPLLRRAGAQNRLRYEVCSTSNQTVGRQIGPSSRGRHGSRPRRLRRSYRCRVGGPAHGNRHRSQRSHRGHRVHSQRARLLGSRGRRRHLHVRPGRLLRIDRSAGPERADRRDGVRPRGTGLLGGGQRRRDLRIRRRPLLRVHRSDPPQPAHRGHRFHPRWEGLLDGGRRRWHLLPR